MNEESKKLEETSEDPKKSEETSEDQSESDLDDDLEVKEESISRSYSNVYIWGFVKAITTSFDYDQTKTVVIAPNWKKAPPRAALIHKRLLEGKSEETYAKDPKKLAKWRELYADYEKYVTRTKTTDLSHEDQLKNLTEILYDNGIIEKDLYDTFLKTIEENNDSYLRNEGYLPPKGKKKETIPEEEELD